MSIPSRNRCARTARGFRPARAAAALVALLATGVTTAAAQELLTLNASGGLYVQQVYGRALIRDATGVSELSLPPGASVRSLEALEGGWMVAGEVDGPGTTDLFLVRSENGERRSFPVPPNAPRQLLRLDPAPLVQGGQLVGLAWIAGARLRESAVFASLWSGVDWSPPEQVSPAGSGTQIGLTGAVLADGSWLLAWSAHDGGDDEIVWSLRGDRGWSEPRLLHPPNDNPDIVPRVVATGPGALAAWSSSDGATYRVRLAGFKEGAWQELDFVGPPASLRPALTAYGEGVLLLYRTVVPSTWTLLELDGRGAPLRRMVLDRETTFRPALVPREGLPPAFEWPGTEIPVPMRLEAEWQSLP